MPEITRDIYVDVNARAIDGWNAKGWEWGTPLSHEEYLKARQGEWRMLLTPTKPVPPAWYPSDLSGLRAVSYTHLDVYKRQFQWGPRLPLR